MAKRDAKDLLSPNPKKNLDAQLNPKRHTITSIGLIEATDETPWGAGAYVRNEENKLNKQIAQVESDTEKYKELLAQRKRQALEASIGEFNLQSRQGGGDAELSQMKVGTQQDLGDIRSRQAGRSVQAASPLRVGGQ